MCVEAEVAVAVVDEWQGRGVGTALLEELRVLGDAVDASPEEADTIELRVRLDPYFPAADSVADALSPAADAA